MDVTPAVAAAASAALFTWPANVYLWYVCFMLRCLNGKLSACRKENMAVFIKPARQAGLHPNKIVHSSEMRIFLLILSVNRHGTTSKSQLFSWKCSRVSFIWLEVRILLFLSLDGRITIISSPGLLNYAALYNPELLARAGLAALLMS